MPRTEHVSTTIQLRLSAELKRRAERASKFLDMGGLSEFVRAAIREKLDRERAALAERQTQPDIPERVLAPTPERIPRDSAPSTATEQEGASSE